MPICCLPFTSRSSRTALLEKQLFQCTRELEERNNELLERDKELRLNQAALAKYKAEDDERRMRIPNLENECRGSKGGEARNCALPVRSITQCEPPDEQKINVMSDACLHAPPGDPIGVKKDRADDRPVSDYFPVPPKGEPLQASLDQLIAVAEAHEMLADVYQFSELPEGASLQEAVAAMVHEGNCPGPYQADTLKYASPKGLQFLGFSRLEDAKEPLAKWWSGGTATTRYALDRGLGSTPLAPTRHWNVMIKNLLQGNYSAYFLVATVNGFSGKQESKQTDLIFIPVVVLGPKGCRSWGMIRQGITQSSTHFKAVSLLSTLVLHQASSFSFTMVSCSDGQILQQNDVSAECFGCQSLRNTLPLGEQSQFQSSLDAGYKFQGKLSSINFLEMLFDGYKEGLSILETRLTGGIYEVRLEITHPILRKWMCIKDGDLVFHDVKVDVTQEVLAQREVQKTHAELENERQRLDLLLQRQSELISCLDKVNGLRDPSNKISVGSSASDEMFEGVVKQIQKNLSRKALGRLEDAIEIIQMIGEGNYGKVYKATWRGSVVAIKSLSLPSHLSGSDQHEYMAVMEAAISSTLSHPNIVQTYTYKVDVQAASNTLDTQIGRPVPLDVKLIQEFCDCGSLSEALNKALFFSEGGTPNYCAILETALDVALGMSHLHNMNVLHLDLKPENVLLKSCVSEERGIVAKIADFGLSLKIDWSVTHVSKVWHGTQTHMAPEVLLDGHQSKAADVYAFGITLWELYSSETPYKNVQSALLAHKVSIESLRPVFSGECPTGFVELAKSCWCGSPNDRPSFDEIVKTLKSLRSLQPTVTERLQMPVHITNRVNDETLYSVG